MVEYVFSLDEVFGALADPTRRDILQRLHQAELTVSQIASAYPLSFAAISKHLKVLEKARLIIKRRRGKERLVQLSPAALMPAAEYVEAFRQLWDERFDSLDNYLTENKE